MTARSFTTAPTLAEFEELARDALLSIPPPLRDYAERVVIQVEDLCDETTEKAMDLDSPYELSGLYWGLSLEQRSLQDVAPEPDMVFLYRLPILLEWCERGEELYTLVRHVLIHEIGHHFGFSDADMETIDRADV